ESIMKKLNHNHIDIMKMDIEGAEYGVLKNLLQSSIRPRILMLEYHHRFKGIGKKKTIDSVNALKRAGYLLVYISPAGREMCFLKEV
ncbi:MAG: FkbM family methyltransferase, partial [Proteobacteria bacterium]|nr:FkbM family methyltransferase [Pseudomonadota bacterium]